MKAHKTRIIPPARRLEHERYFFMTIDLVLFCFIHNLDAKLWLNDVFVTCFVYDRCDDVIILLCVCSDVVEWIIIVFFFMVFFVCFWNACNHHWLIFITLPGPSLTILLCLTWITSLQDKILYFGYYWTLGFLFVLLRSWLSRNWILKIYFFKSFRSMLFYNFRSHPKFFLHGSKMTLFKKELIILFILFFSL